MYEGGQAASVFHSDRAESDAEDPEFSAATETETEARTTSLGAGYKQPGTSDSSIKRFMLNGVMTPEAHLLANMVQSPNRTRRRWPRGSALGMMLRRLLILCPRP